MATSGGWSISGAPGGKEDVLPACSPQEPHQLTPAVAWLLSDDASYATGTAMRVAGGR